MLSKYVLPGDKVELQAVDKIQLADGTIGHKTYASEVHDILGEDNLELLMPMEKTKLILLPIDGEYDLYFYTKTGLYQCYARIVDRYKSENIYLLNLELTSNLRKHQRREYYRFSCVLEMNTRILKEEEVDAIGKNLEFLVPSLPLKRSIVVDISGGGLRFISKQLYDVGSMIYCKYQLVIDDQVKEYNLVGRVLYSGPVANRPDEFEHRVQYVNIDNQTREEIIRYIFEEERKHRKRDRG